ncbi:putative oxidoreductase [Corynebacterium ciconiae DSM 44920]|uniref:SDR family oxidoreductase n=1 Tax=Corynebacterium ciconiae TaxID=227319 RepID=UPI00037DD551|nr:SDR family oxidoreductase [Corynebacterium ciconiae]WKD62255.1 putative oxidoreductase [Corynebacterium ciconiae DSM 44920]
MRTAVVTGASGGVGREIAEQLIDAGWSVYAQYRSDSPSTDKARAAVSHASWFHLDFNSPEPDLSAVPEIRSLDALIHCAGYCQLNRIENASSAEWQDSFNVNLHGPVALTNRLLPALRAAQGTMVYLNSGAGFRVKPEWGSYAASKFAARAWCDGLREEEPDIRVSSVHPGRIDTRMQRAIVAYEGGTYEPREFLTAETVARSVVQVITTPMDAHPAELVLRPRSH